MKPYHLPNLALGSAGAPAPLTRTSRPLRCTGGNAALALWLLLLTPSLRMEAADITVFAAASLKESLGEIAREYGKVSGDTVHFNFAASGLLARQIEEGVPADVFFSADEVRVEALERQGLVAPGTRASRLRNSLVIVVPPEATNVSGPRDLTNAAVARVAIGDVRTVPAGTYAKAYLEKAGLWRSLEPRLIPCESVRGVLAAVASGNVDAGIVYRTDARASAKVRVAFAVPEAEGPDILYPVALLKRAPAAEAARRFLDYLGSAPATVIFRGAGFTVLEKEAGR